MLLNFCLFREEIFFDTSLVLNNRVYSVGVPPREVVRGQTVDPPVRILVEFVCINQQFEREKERKRGRAVNE